MKPRHIISFMIALLAVRVFLAAVMPVFDTSEARYAAISANMDRTGDFLVPHFTYKGRYQSFDGKPPLQFQLSGLCCRLFGRSEFAVRLPILLAALGMLALMWKTVAALGDRRRATMSVGIAASCVAYYALAGCCMPDGLLVPCVAGAYFCHVLFLRTQRRAWTLGVFAALAMGMLVKGPVAIALFAGPVFIDTCVNRRWSAVAKYRWVTGMLLFVAVAAPWFVLMTRENPDFLEYFFVNENIRRFLVHDYGDKYGAGREFFRGMALVWAVVVTLPWFPFAVWMAWRRRTVALHEWLRSGDGSCALAWGIVGITGFWCLTSRIPLAYLMPIVPLFAAWLALKGRVEMLSRVFPYAASTAMLVLSGALLAGALFTDKMLGARAPYRRNRYSHEFYHGQSVIKENMTNEISGAGHTL